MSAQLRHVLAAGQSAQVAQKDQQDVAPAAQRAAHRDGLAVRRVPPEVWSDVACFQHNALSRVDKKAK